MRYFGAVCLGFGLGAVVSGTAFTVGLFCGVIMSDMPDKRKEKTNGVG